MANADRPNGFIYVANLTGGGEYIEHMTHALADTVAIGRGDLVTPTGAARTVEQYDNNDPVWGLSLSYVALSTLGYPDVIHLNHTSVLEAQEDSGGGAADFIAAADQGLNAQIVVAAANTTTGLSNMEVDSNTAATTTTLALRLLRPVPRPGNTVAAINCRWFVTPLELDIAEAKAGI